MINQVATAKETGKIGRKFFFLYKNSLPLDIVVNNGYSAYLQASQENESTELFNNAYQTSTLTTANFGYAC